MNTITTTWWRRIERVRRFDREDWRIARASIGVLLTAQAFVWLRRTPRATSWALTVRSGQPPATPDQVTRIAWIADAIGRRVLGMRCLARALGVARILGAHGVHCDIRIGVATANGGLQAHAWVEWQGRALNETARHLSGFAPLDRPIGRARAE